MTPDLSISVLLPPCIHSGESHRTSVNPKSWALQPATPSVWLAHDGAILVSIRVQHSGFTATFLVNLTVIQGQQYRALLAAFQAAVAALRPGASLDKPRVAAEKALQAADQVSLCLLCL